jgi:hypothetical protein
MAVFSLIGYNYRLLAFQTWAPMEKANKNGKPKKISLKPN